MADRILMNKNTLATLKNELKEYNTALPVFEMKEQKLKEVVQTLENNIRGLEKDIAEINAETKKWVAVMADNSVELSGIVRIKSEKTSNKEIAGVTIEVFGELTFEKIELDVFNTPLWVDDAIEVIQQQKIHQTQIEIQKRNLKVLGEELAEARRMKNALKEVFIPETKTNIRKIEIYLGDVERLAIGCAKLVKKKKEEKKTAV